MGLPLSPAVGIVLVAALIAAVTDIWKFKVYNLLTVPLLLSGLLYHAVTGGPAELSNSLLGALLGFGLLIVFYVLGGMGAGDVKLLAAVGAWLGVQATFYVFIASSLAAAAYAVALLVLYRGLGEAIINMQIVWHRFVSFSRYLGADDRLENEMRRADRRQRTIPFAAMMALGMIGLLVWFWQLGVH